MSIVRNGLLAVAGCAAACAGVALIPALGVGLAGGSLGLGLGAALAGNEVLLAIAVALAAGAGAVLLNRRRDRGATPDCACGQGDGCATRGHCDLPDPDGRAGGEA
jgi:hypothetical protein